MAVAKRNLEEIGESLENMGMKDFLIAQLIKI